MNLRPRLALTVLVTSAPLVAGIAYLRADLDRQGTARSMREFALLRMREGDRHRAENDPFNYPAPPFELRRMEDRRLGRVPDFEDRPPRREERGGPPWRGERRSGERPPGEPRYGDERGPGGRLAERGREGRPGGRGPRPRPANILVLFAYDEERTSANPEVAPFPEELAAQLDAGADIALHGLMRGGEHALQVAFATGWEGNAAHLFIEQSFPTPPFAPAKHLWTSTAAALALLGVVLLAAGPIVSRARRLEREVRRAAGDTGAEPITLSGNDELNALAQAFNEANDDVRAHVDELASRERTLRQFVENTSHDIAIPLTVLKGHLAGLREQLGSGPDEPARAAGEALEEVEYISALLANLDAAARLDAGPEGLTRAPVDLAALVERVAARYRPFASQREISLEHGVPAEGVTFEGDVTLLEQSLSNLVQNAIRHGRQGGHVAVVLEGTESGFALRVVDDGPGLSDEDRECVLERSWRGSVARERTPDGRGIGLAITLDIAARHRLRLTLENHDEGGLVATLAT